MSALKFVVLCAVIVAASLRSAGAVSAEDTKKIQVALMPSVAECAKQLGVQIEAVMKAKETSNSDLVDKCFFACFFKKAGFMNEKGLFDKDLSMATTKSIVSTEEIIKNSLEVVDMCIKVNDAPSDAEGCDRAKLLFACFQQHKDKYAL